MCAGCDTEVSAALFSPRGTKQRWLAKPWSTLLPSLAGLKAGLRELVGSPSASSPLSLAVLVGMKI